jgi:hypothetical protein
MAEQLLALANQSRAQVGLGRLQWDPALASAAMRHCERMAVEGPIAHRYTGELDLSSRAGAAGAHFSLIEENIAVGPYASTIHQGWLDSPGHRANLLNREIDRVGIAVIAAHGVLYATADYERDVPVLSQPQVEASIASLISASGVAIGNDAGAARAICALDRGVPASERGGQPGFVMRWQDADLSHLPRPLTERLASGQYRQAVVGSCPPKSVEGAFTVYRIAVLLY